MARHRGVGALVVSFAVKWVSRAAGGKSEGAGGCSKLVWRYRRFDPPKPRVVLTRLDQERLERILAAAGSRPDLDSRREEIDRAEVVASEVIPADRVTMNSRVRFVDETTGQTHEITLVFRGHADAGDNPVSILAPIGSALLGLSVGDTIEWPVPRGKSRKIRVVEVIYQPEAVGDPI